MFNALRYLKEYPFELNNVKENTCLRGDGSHIDFLITTENIPLTYKQAVSYPTVSDHKLLLGEISMNVGAGRNRMIIPNRKLGKEIIQETLKNSVKDDTILNYVESTQ